MNRIVRLTILAGMLVTTTAQEAEAQFFKKLFGGGEKKETQPRQKSRPPRTTKPENVKSREKRRVVDYPKSVLKLRYRVDVFLPLYLSENVPGGKPVSRDQLTERSLSGINFYEGLKMAADSLTKLGFSADVYIHDVTDPAFAPRELIRTGALDETDLVIGGLTSTHIPELADFCQKHHVNFISAFSPADADVKGNPFFTLMQPSLERHCKDIAERLFKNYPDAVPYLFYRKGDASDSLAMKYFTADKNRVFRKVACDGGKPDIAWIARFADTAKPNIAIMAIVDAGQADLVLKELKTTFSSCFFDVFGLPSWKALPSLRKADAYPNIAVTISTPFYFDPTATNGQVLAQQYRKEFGSYKPSELVFRGYETFFWYLTLLNKYGTVFNSNMSDREGQIFSKYQIREHWTPDNDLLYQANEKNYFLRYQAGTFSVSE